jgi:hypothetical protein
MLLLLLLQGRVHSVLRQRQQQALARLVQAQALLSARRVLRALNLRRQRLAALVVRLPVAGCLGLHLPVEVRNQHRITSVLKRQTRQTMVLCMLCVGFFLGGVWDAGAVLVACLPVEGFSGLHPPAQVGHRP